MNMLTSKIGIDGGSSSGTIRVFVVDDSATVRSAFSRMIEDEPGLELAGTAISAEDALNQLGSMLVHVILLDLEMPGMGGMRAIPEIVRRAGSAKIIVVSTLTAAGAEHTVQALAQGAADALQKPAPGDFGPSYRSRLIERIRELGRRPLRRTAPESGRVGAGMYHPPFSSARAEVLAIGASTGGIHATGLLLAALPRHIGVPILVTQHLPIQFIRPYAQQLEEISGRSVAIAADGLVLAPDRIVLAAGDAHLGLVRVNQSIVVHQATDVSETGCMPSVDPMFEAVARIFGAGALGVVLTGMGRDGSIGARAIVEVGGSVIAQNEVSSAVWGMPGSVARAGCAAAVLHPTDIALRIAACTRSV